ncbi:penicillin acylase family protein [Maribacter thermophilus]|uniref:penicillin acylase family protein n=1 Tax=Maribacter thermophilus TaxID=1197874 RepID=UPI00064107C3|nr:penicillin acylase family protein [Maribacter thermophilus]
MKTLKKIGILFLVLAVLAGIAAIIFVQILKPDYSGEKVLVGLKQNVDVYYDKYGVPHIYSENELDAFRALGYVHAQDRLWQMELLRRIGSGGLSEVFGKNLITTDKFFLSLGIDDASKKAIDELNKNSEAVGIISAYLDGVNQFIAEGPTPVEFYLTGIDKKEFTINDVYNTMGYMAFSFAMGHKTDPLLTNIKDKLGPEYLADLPLHSSTDTEWIKNYPQNKTDSIGNSITAMVTNVLGKLELPLFEGSNSWVIAPEKTKNGKVIFANDPHIGFAQPSVWYEAHIETPTYSKYGYHMAGIPFPVLGHNRNLAYGMTMFENDDVDFYYEENNPSNDNQYKKDGKWVDYEEITKTIKVKDWEDVTFSFKKSSHGPILNGIADQVVGERPIAMSWIYTQEKNTVVDAFYELSHAENLTAFKKALPKIHAPGLNIMYGDAEGNIGWFATAKLYRIPDSVNTKLVYEYDKGLPEQKEYLDFSENPQAVNPPWHYVYSANNQPDSIAGMLYPGYYLPENRAKRIVQLLEPKDDWDTKEVSKMILDVTSPVHKEIIESLTQLVDRSQLDTEEVALLDSLRSWDGTYSLKSVEATVYTGWVYYLLKNIFKDELGPEMFNQLLSTHLVKRSIAPIIANKKSIWWDNVATADLVESREVIVQHSFLDAIRSLKESLGPNAAEWTWNKVHTLEHGHPIGQVEALRSFFNVGPFPVHGTREVINNLAFPIDSTGLYKVSSGPSTRRVIDFSDVENSISILPTGQSGNPFSEHYDDQAQMYIEGKFRKMMMNEEEIKSKASSVLVFKAK